MRSKFLMAAIVGAAALLPACAMAAQVIENANIPTASVPFSYTFFLPSFNTSLGTLQSVVYELTETATPQVDIFNATGTSQSFSNATASIPLSVTGPGGLGVTTTVSTGPISGVAAPGLNMYPGSTETAAENTTITNNLAQFQSGSPVSLTYIANGGPGSYSGTGVSGLFFGGSATAGGTFELIYNYVAGVPEPATWGLLLVGLAGIGAAMRSRRKQDLALASV